jgi:hypothetical protein
VNRALSDGELRPFVEALATRIASFPAATVARAKAAVDASLTDPTGGLLIEAQQFRASLSDPETQPRLGAFMDLGGQTRHREIQGLVQ